MSNPWFKFYGGDYLSDPKTRNFSTAEHSCWMHLMCFALNSTTAGTVEQLSEERLMMYSGVKADRPEWAETIGVLKRFQKKGMIKLYSDKIVILNWQKRQEVHSESWARVKRWRDKKRNELETLQSNGKNRIDKNRIDKNTPKEVGNGDFDKFWEAYPRKVGKLAALRAWKKAKLPKIKIILDAIESQKKSDQWSKDNGQFIPHPATWLNQGRWDDQTVSRASRVDKF